MQCHHDRRPGFGDRQITALPRAAGQRHAQDRLRHFIRFNQLLHKTLQFLGRKRRSDFQEVGAAGHPFQVLRQPERPGVHDPHGFEKAVPIHETAVVDGNHCFRLGYKPAIEKNGHVFLMRSQYPKCGDFASRKIDLRISPILPKRQRTREKILQKSCPVLVETGINR